MKSSRGNSSNSTSIVDKENSVTSNKTTVNLHPRQRAKQKYVQEQEESQAIAEQPNHQMTLSARLESIEQKLMKLQSLKDETLDEFTSLLNELNEVVPILNQLIPSTGVATDSSEILMEKESGLSKLLNRLQQLQQEYQKRRSVSEKRLKFKISTIKERYTAEILHNKNESESELAESSVAFIHKQMAKVHSGTNTLKTNEEASASSTSAASSGSSSVISARKRSLPVINQPVTACPPAMKMARRQSVTAYSTANNNNTSNPNHREITNSSILNLNLVTSSKSVADADLLAIKSRISKALKR